MTETNQHSSDRDEPNSDRVQGGIVVLEGKSAENFRLLDAVFREWASVVSATEYHFPPVLTVRTLDEADYFSSFPHLATLITRIDRSNGGVARYISDTDTASPGRKQIDSRYLEAAQFVLPSAACYAVYDHFRDRQLSAPEYVTLASPCFRHEDHYTRGQRQWAFHMREIVCLGPESSVKSFLETYRRLITDKLTSSGLEFSYKQATDPFFNKRDPRRMVQRIEPLKHEFLFRDSLAIASINFHRTFFGERYRITDGAGESVCTGCVAFGVERWLYACTQEFGDASEDWPVDLR